MTDDGGAAIFLIVTWFYAAWLDFIDTQQGGE